MCILSYIPAGVDVDTMAQESLYTGGLLNPDGHGWAIASPDGFLVMGRSLSLDNALSSFVTARSKYPAGPALFHSRWATHGSVRIGNCHPFMVGGSHLTVMAHNGVLPKSAHPAMGDDRSDTAIMADDILPTRYRRLDRPGVRRALTDYCGRGNKLVILTVDPRYQSNAYVINESCGQWEGDTGMWHSNSDYTYRPFVNTTVGTTPDGYYVDPTECYLCFGRVNDYGVCTTCGTCQDCYECEHDCLCLYPSGARM